ncbi:extracellular matrix protein FRAS1-like isoform X2 [Cyanistes caeruleus]|uniref:extracellular matrix protein FRAS1-like isoform X2 n=1 Tax=Cyanistes caeruleus TaxID=156563 RepID=UPI000CDB16AF|nr:extracellular matrix protein FRAS1-like isoform X2 [Cyanistes caeruleus]
MTVQEGVRKTIMEFELKATDADTEVESLTFGAVQPPRHGLMERSGHGQRPLQATTFTTDDIYQKRGSYSHRGGSALRDRFTLTVSDGTSPLFVVQEGGKKVWPTSCLRWRSCPTKTGSGTSPFLWCWAQMILWKQDLGTC